MRKLLPCLILMIATGLIAAPASAQFIALADYVGFGWETGGYPPSNPGDVLEFAGVASSVDPILGIDLGTTEVTFYMHSLVSTGAFVAGGNTIIGYAGGVLEMYADPAQNAAWGVSPPNATAPSSFMDGALLFQGSFTSFTVVITPSGAGAYEGALDGVSGSILSAVCNDCAYTWGGAFTQDVGAQIPVGYDFQMDGVLEVDQAVPSTPDSWGAVKALYRD